MQRATRWLLRLPEAPSSADNYLPTELVQFDLPARQWLTRQVQVLGHWQGGAVFGTRQEGALRVSLVMTLGPPGWMGHPLVPSLPYLIGASESASLLAGDTLDWVGQWIAAPDGRLPDTRDDLLWLTLGARQGRFDDQHPLVMVGLQEGYLVGRAYIWDEGEPIAVGCSLGPPQT